LLGSTLDGKPIVDGNAFADLALNEARVALVGGNDFGAPGHVRMSYATSRENLNIAFDRLTELLARIERPVEHADQPGK
jgi:aspartate aminotransferase